MNRYLRSYQPDDDSEELPQAPASGSGERSWWDTCRVQIAKLDVCPGETLVFRVPDTYTQLDVARLARTAARMVPPGVKAAVLSDRVELVVVRDCHVPGSAVPVTTAQALYPDQFDDVREAGKCIWTSAGDGRTWSGACEEEGARYDSTPLPYTFCPACGGEIEQRDPYEADEDND